MINSYYAILCLVYLVGIPCYLLLVCDKLGDDCKFHMEKASPGEARRALIWPIFLLWISFIAIVLLIREVVWPFILTLFGRTK